MITTRNHSVISRTISYIVLAYGVLLVVEALQHQLHIHRHHHDLSAIIVSVPLLVGLSYIYLANLLLRLKYNAWLVSAILSMGITLFNIYAAINHDDEPLAVRLLRIVVPLALLSLLIASRAMFRVRSDSRSFARALRVSAVILLVTFLYGITGFSLLDRHDFHRHITLATAAHQTIDQFGLTTKTIVPHTRRASVFIDSLSAISIGAVAYTALSFFQPLRARFTNQSNQREHAERLLREYPSDIDDFFKLWPHDKQYVFTANDKAGLAYHVTRGVALVVADPFGDRRSFGHLLDQFEELCFVNDWLPGFIHVGQANRYLYSRHGYRLQKIGEEAVLDIQTFVDAKRSKYFRQINNRFTKLGYSVELLEPPHSKALLQRLQAISDEWLARPGRSERGFMLGYFSEAYMQLGPVVVVRDDAAQIQGFINLVPTYAQSTTNYDLLRCADNAPGNCNDFLMLGLLDILHTRGISTFNLGLCPLSGLDTETEDVSVIDSALRFVYANGDRFYSFSGLRRFKAKYEPEWHGRYVVYRNGITGFTRTMAALNRAMKVRHIKTP